MFFCCDDAKDDNESITGIGELKNETRTTRKFSRLHLKGSGEVTFIQEESDEIVISAQQNILDILSTEVHGDELYVDFEKSIRKHDGIIIFASSANLSSITTEGAWTFFALSGLETDILEIHIEGAADFDIQNLICNELETFINGTGNIFMSGDSTVNYCDFRIKGTGNINTRNLQVEDMNVEVEGTGIFDVFVISFLNIQADGVLTLKYLGFPDIKKNIKGIVNIYPSDY